MGFTSLEADKAMLLEKEKGNKNKKMVGEGSKREQEPIYV